LAIAQGKWFTLTQTMRKHSESNKT